MSAGHELQNAYQEWRRIAEAEGEAIRQRNWPAVAEFQSALEKLQPRIIQFTNDARQRSERAEVVSSGAEKDFRTLIAEVVEIERRNQSLLKGLHEAAQSQVNQLEQAGHKLRQVQRSYAPPPPPAWTSFS